MKRVQKKKRDIPAPPYEYHVGWHWVASVFGVFMAMALSRSQCWTNSSDLNEISKIFPHISRNRSTRPFNSQGAFRRIFLDVAVSPAATINFNLLPP